MKVETFTTFSTLVLLCLMRVLVSGHGDRVVEWFVTYWVVRYTMDNLTMGHKFTSTVYACFAHPAAVFMSFWRFA